SGAVGAFMVHFVRFWMGHVVHVATLVFLGAGLMLALDYRRATNIQMVLGTAGFMVMLFGWIHLSYTQGPVFASTGARLAQLLGRAHDPALLKAADGGFFGAVIMTVMSPLGTAGAYVTLAAI